MTVFDGIAKPTPSLPPDSLSIWALTPITRPWRSSRGPPELPWLIAASVWIASSIAKLFGAWIWRCRALTIPLVTVSSSPNGLPIATTPSPTSTCEESARASGVSWLAGTSTLRIARSVEGSLPTSVAETVLPFENCTLNDEPPETTCSFVTMWPAVS